MNAEIEIRQGTPEDFPALLRLVKELAEFEKAPDSVTNTVERMESDTSHFDFFCAVDSETSEVVGVAVYFFAYFTWVGKSLYLDDLYVKPEYRGQGIASELLNKVFATAHAEDCQRVRWQVLDWNEPAIKVYEKLGARLDSEWINCDFTPEQIAKLAEV